MRKQKTAKNKRTTYKYYSLDETEKELTQDDVGEEWITILHGMDDEEIDAQRREEYHIPARYDAYDDDDQNSYLADESADPLNLLVEKSAEEVSQNKISRLSKALLALAPEQWNLIKKIFYEKKSVTSTAAECGVSRVTIYKRLDKIYAFLREKIEI